MKKPFTLKEIKPKIFLLTFTDHYDMCMYFLRYQEYYESASPKFRGKSFEILDFMKWYSAKYGKGAFTYPIDWAGFNFPGHTIKEVWDKGITDKNIYDYEMKEVYKICQESAGDKFYIIGVVKGNGALEHEIAHGFFYLNPDFKKEMVKLVSQLDKGLRKSFNSFLSKIGYTPKVYMDETQANLATTKNFLTHNVFSDATAEALNKAAPAFRAVFKKYNKE